MVKSTPTVNSESNSNPEDSNKTRPILRTSAILRLKHYIISSRETTKENSKTSSETGFLSESLLAGFPKNTESDKW